MSEPLLELRAIDKDYHTDGVTSPVLRSIDLQIRRGEFVALIGPSGSGKSTLLNIIGLLERPSRGQVWLNGHDATRCTEHELTSLRGRSIGFVFQFHHLISAFSAAENLMLPLLLEQGGLRPEMRTAALQALTRVGLAEKANIRPTQLSGGQQQRVAVARALMRNPPLVLADEPTGNLDTKSADSVFELLREHNRQMGAAFLIVTHDPRLSARCDRVVEIVDGRIKSDRTTPLPRPAGEPVSTAAEPT